MPAATDVLEGAKQHQQSIYDSAEAVAQLFIRQQGELLQFDEAVRAVLESNSVAIESPRLAARTINHLVEDIADPVTSVPTDDGRYVGVIEYAPRDFYYESTQFHDVRGESTKAVCARCVEESTFDHQAVAYPDRQQYRKQVATDHAIEGADSIPVRSTEQDRRNVLGAHYLDAHTDLTAHEVAGASQTPRDQILYVLSNGTSVPERATVNMNYSPGDVLKRTGITIDHVMESFDLGIDSITVGATLVSGTTIGGNTAIHGGNQSSFNVEAFGTASSTSGEVPTSQGDGTLAMQTPSGGGGGIYTEDANSPFSANSTDDVTFTLDGTYSVVKAIITADSSSTADNQVDLQVNGVSSDYFTRLSDGSPSGDPHFKGAFRSQFGVGTVLTMSGSWDHAWQINAAGGDNPNAGTNALHGANSTVSSPLNTIRIFDDATGNFSITMRIWGIPV